MRNTILLVIFLAFVAMGLGLWLFRQNLGDITSERRLLRVGEMTVSVEIADTPEQRTRGLSGRENLGENEGLLFIFPESQQRSFWMKDMRFPLDMVFIDEGEVVEIVRGVPAPSEGSDGTEIRVVSKFPAEWVLEVNSGWVERQGVKLEDSVKLDEN
jgi:uncharacterized membrane protein (UPF0127 family)